MSKKSKGMGLTKSMFFAQNKLQQKQQMHNKKEDNDDKEDDQAIQGVTSLKKNLESTK
jgi:hypothetical protein